MAAIQSDNLTKYYGQEIGIKDVSLEILSGEIFGFVGPNGAGKSTAIRTLLGLLIPTSGSAKIFGQDVASLGHKIRMDIGYLPSEVNYYDEMSSRELLEYHCRFYGIYDYADVDRLADVFELDLDKEITDLSFGNRKKCGIIQALLHKPKLLIMDEPTSGLDPLMQNVFYDVLRKERENGTTIFFSSHILSEVQNICDRAAIIKHGEINAIENIQSLLQKQMKKGVLVFNQKPSRLEFPNGIQKQKWYDNRLSFEYVGPVDKLIQWMSQLDLLDVILEEPELESIFMNYYENDHE
ncbi:MAG: ABC transporter ATP-binding protein [Saprospiraceae bacterium]|nr:ABC transporter ATP-binding protein [Bacteroidia bacterium]NNL93438.1 ABC transporter ATP-binding protein [Saprospiraceae bacterium]